MINVWFSCEFCEVGDLPNFHLHFGARGEVQNYHNVNSHAWYLRFANALNALNVITILLTEEYSHLKFIKESNNEADKAGEQVQFWGF